MMGFNLEFSIALLITLVVGLSFHEFGHAAMATKMGDPTPRLQGRLTLNPVKHLDPAGAFFLVFMAFAGFGFAWGKPVQTNPAYYSNYRQGTILVAIAGPAMNLCLAMLAIAVGFVLYQGNVPLSSFGSTLLFAFIYVNLLLMIFNLLPIPPLDGGHVMEQVLPWDLRHKFRRIQAFGLLIILALWFTGILGRIIGFIFSILMFLIGLGFGQGYVEYLFGGF